MYQAEVIAISSSGRALQVPAIVWICKVYPGPLLKWARICGFMISREYHGPPF
jgi:hypothetical protein